MPLTIEATYRDLNIRMVKSILKNNYYFELKYLFHGKTNWKKENTYNITKKVILMEGKQINVCKTFSHHIYSPPPTSPTNDNISATENKVVGGERQAISSKF